jgi:hypothetical protein
VYDAWEDETRLCAEHIAVRRLGEDMDAYYHALESIQAFLESEPVKQDPYRTLSELAIEWYDSVTRSASEAALKFKVAKFLASQGPDNMGPEDPIMREHEPSEEERLALIATVEEASDAVDKELEEFKAMDGVPRDRAERPA